MNVIAKKPQIGDFYHFRTEPLAHQRAELTEHWSSRIRAILWDQGLGKSKLVLDNAGALIDAHQVDALVVFTKPGLEKNWLDQLQEHLPTHLIHEGMILVYESKKAANKGATAERAKLALWPGPVFVLMSYDAACATVGRRFLDGLFRRRRVFVVADESHSIKTPGAKRTKWLRALAQRAVYRRILSGTPATEGPFDFYAQYAFLDANYWKQYQIKDFNAFKYRFGEWSQMFTLRGKIPVFERPKDIDVLTKLREPVTTRLLKSEVLDLPPKVYQRRHVELSKEQRALYEEIKKECKQLLQGGPHGLLTLDRETSSVPSEAREWIPREDSRLGMAIVRLLRLQQIAGGFAPDGRPLECHKFTALLDEVQSIAAPEYHNNQLIVWAVFTREVEHITKMLHDVGYDVARYDGTMTRADRDQSLDDFKSGLARILVANPQAGGTGLNLQHCSDVIYYSRGFKLLDRLQSEDRTHRIGQKNSVRYVDIVADDSADIRVLDALRKKREISAQVTADEILEWI